jgi:multiple sugar transport system ATP-binding protein
MLRIQQGRQIIVGLRSEAVRIAAPSTARPGEVVLSGIVEHLEYQGHESLVHLNTGSRPAVVPELENPRPTTGTASRARASKRGMAGLGARLNRLTQQVRSGNSGTGTALLEAPDQRDELATQNLPGDLVVRVGPDLDLRPGERVPLLVDLEHLYVFDHAGNRICPAPAEIPNLTY